MINKFKNFRFLRKCFGFIGACVLTLGIVDFKKVDALNVSEPTDTLIQNYLSSVYSIDEESLLIPLSDTRIDEARAFINNDGSSSLLHNCIGSLADNLYSVALDVTDTYIICINNTENSEDLYSLTCSYKLDYNYNLTGVNKHFNQDIIDFVPSSTTTYFAFEPNQIIIDFANTYGVWSAYNKFGTYEFYQIDCLFEFDLSNFSSAFDNNIYVYSEREINGFYKGAGLNYSSAYNQGYSRGVYDTINNDYQGKTYNEIYELGNTQGFSLGKADTINNDYQGKTYSQIYDLGSSDTINNDYQGKTYNQIYSTGRNVGYNEGQASVTNSSATIGSLFSSIANTPLTILNGLLPATIFGVPIITILFTFLSILIIIWLIKVLLHR